MGVLGVLETGGTVTDINGKALDFSKQDTLVDNQGVVVSNGEIHDEVLAVLATTAN